MALSQDRSISRAIGNLYASTRENREFFGRIVGGAIGNPFFYVTVLLHCLHRTNRSGKDSIMLSKFMINIRFPIQHRNQIVEIMMMTFRDILDQKFPRYRPAINHRLKHGKNIAIYLWLIGYQRTRSVQNARVHLPTSAGLKTIGFRVE